MPSKKKKPASTKPASRKAGVWLNLPGKARSVELRSDPAMQEIAWRWNYALRNRSRWTSRGESAQRQRSDIHELVRSFGLTEPAIATLAAAGLIEVDIPWQSEEVGWELRIFPWEYVLAAVTREQRHAQRSDFTVVRHLRNAARTGAKGQDKFLYVESAPVSALSDGFDFTDERKVSRAAAQGARLEFVEVLNPTLAQLAAQVAQHQPRVVHLTGFDIHQARALLNPDAEESPRDGRHVYDGYLLADGRGGVHEVPSLKLAEVLAGHDAPPDLVCCNFYYSGPRTAALCVASGARAAIGFQDTFDDLLAEQFFATLYRAWAFAERSATSAFQFAWLQLRAGGRRVTGTGLVLWNSESIAPVASKRAPPIPSKADIESLWNTKSKDVVTAATARRDLAVNVQEIEKLNYSMLHNNRPLLRTFTIAKRRDEIGLVEGIEVTVELYVGRDSYPFRLQVDIPATLPSIDIADRVRVSLTSTLNRAIRESVRTSVRIQVVYDGTTLFHDTRRVTLLPVDEWEDSDANRKWLPSFVLPRDPAVALVIDRSQRYLQALKDDPTAGFDGYQSVIELDAKRGKYDCGGVDLQVRAIWSALLYETPLSYINPPPTFTDSSQRLRSPSEVIDGRRGTCIDLALLVASCLEYVEIFPTLVLLTDHAFPCYWRAEAYFDKFALARSDAIDTQALRGAAGSSATPQQSDSWYYVKAHFQEVMGEIAAGRLVPIESTCLCWKDSFAEACEQGRKNLSRRSRFDSMLDVRSARTDEYWAVTPLPLLRTEA